MGVLNDISTCFDNLADNPGIERIKTMGDAYLAAVGLPDDVANRSVRAAHMALDLNQAVTRFNEHSRYKLKVQIGIDKAPALAVADLGSRTLYNM